MSVSGRGGRFATTRWTMVNAAGHPSDPHTAAALAELCQIYWPPLYSYLRRRGHDAEQAQDLTQGFFAHLLERHDLRNVDQARGRFRGFLLTAIKRYAINEHERATAARRGGAAHPPAPGFRGGRADLRARPAQRRDARAASTTASGPESPSSGPFSDSDMSRIRPARPPSRRRSCPT